MIEIANKRRLSPNRGMDGWQEFYVGRPNPLGNPIKITYETNREQAVALYEIHLKESLHTHNPVRAEFSKIMKAVVFGDNVRLICWCYPQLCHANVIAKIAQEIAQKYKHNFDKFGHDPYVWGIVHNPRSHTGEQE